MAAVLLEMADSLEPKTKWRYETVHRAGLSMSAACEFLASAEEVR